MAFKIDGHVRRYPFVSVFFRCIGYGSTRNRAYLTSLMRLSNKLYAYLTNSIDPLELPETWAVKFILHIFGLLFVILWLPRVIHLIWSQFQSFCFGQSPPSQYICIITTWLGILWIAHIIAGNHISRLSVARRCFIMSNMLWYISRRLLYSKEHRHHFLLQSKYPTHPYFHLHST